MDAILNEGTKTLSGYDFETDVDVNILGHIFEHSLTEIEELQQELEGKPIEKSKTKRKKEGVFYTPRYITKYIVVNTLGALCTQKKEALAIDEQTFAPQKRKANRKALQQKVHDYRNWLLELTICDPACGSGAFLNAALEYLIAEHRLADELLAKIFGDAIVYTDVENSILENNLYGVDINEDAVEIAKLSLWLHTAKKGRKLSNLSRNIKCGNSLIDDESVAGDKAFKWEKEFPVVFGKRHELFLDFINMLKDSMKLYDVTEEELKEDFENVDPEGIKEIKEISGIDVHNLHDYIEQMLLTLNEGQDNMFLWFNLISKDPATTDMLKKLCEEYRVPFNSMFYVIIISFLKDLENNFDAYETFYLEQEGDKDNVGFDVVIGNPPYVKVQNLPYKQIDWFKTTKRVAHKRVDISIMFFELAKSIMRKGAILSFITSNQFLVAEYGRKAREFIIDNFRIKKIIDFGDLPVFEDALTYVSVFTLENNTKQDFLYQKVMSLDEAKQGNFSDLLLMDVNKLNGSNWILSNNLNIALIDKLERIDRLETYAKASYGIISGSDDFFIVDNNKVKELSIENECLLPLIRSNNCYRYGFSDFDYFIVYPYYFQNGETSLIPLNELEKSYPNTYDYLIGQKSQLESRRDSRTTFENSLNWYSLTRFGQLDIFKKEKIVCPGEQNHTKFGIDLNKAGYSGARVFGITTKDEELSLKFLLSILNSQIIEFYIHSKFPLKQGGYFSLSSTFLNKLPIKKIEIQEQQPFIDKADTMLSKNKELNQVSEQFTKLLRAKFPAININNKLQSWYSLTANDFLKELSKQKIKLSLAEQQEWLQYFEQQKINSTNIQQTIQQTDKEIDAMVYELYGLSEEEIGIVEKHD